MFAKPPRLALGRIAAALFALGFCVAAAGADLQGRVVAVHDGDTITVLVERRQVKVRLAEIDAPELGQPIGTRSRHSLAGMCFGKVAHVQDHGRDRYGRTIGLVRCDSTESNTEQVRQGMAWVFRHYAPKTSPLYEIETEARGAHRGLWSDANAVPPWEWRKRERAAREQSITK